ncbi:hypothetical protein SCMU_14450 [Sinomonas cyclohexanicum]|uniref:Permuted papain-like amidase YaeF/Yiix C92 family enzyme n=1 Tax=Sinomonas cyclohexanicum TaxID=322009 RepID=A0ABM7PTZ1_SINCY|nr:hypothetical protein [Corynebacterium cyclohexanicum]BCT75603.1 hypothetical protein SCMU_14450 [Corynebacterium cyclohexanicum]
MGDPLPGQVAVIPAHRAPVPWLIAAATGSHSYHMVCAIGGGRVVSAEPGGVRFRLVSEWPTAVWSQYPLSGLAGQRAADFAVAQVGKPYAFADDALIGVERLLRFRFPGWVRRAYEADGQWQCAQLATATLLAGGVDPFPGDRDKLGDVAPGDYERAFVRAGWVAASVFSSVVLAPW